MEFISAKNFKTNCLALLNEVAQSRVSIVITKPGKPVAKVVPFDEKKNLLQKPLKGRVVFLGNVVSPIETI